MSHNPLQHTGMGQTRYHDKQHSDHNNRRAAETGERLFGIQHSGQKQDSYAAQEDQIRAELGEQQHGKHRENRDDRDPSVTTKSPQYK